jgi:hypothetical protein
MKKLKLFIFILTAVYLSSCSLSPTDHYKNDMDYINFGTAIMKSELDAYVNQCNNFYKEIEKELNSFAGAFAGELFSSFGADFDSYIEKEFNKTVEDIDKITGDITDYLFNNISSRNLETVNDSVFVLLDKYHEYRLKDKIKMKNNQKYYNKIIRNCIQSYKTAFEENYGFIRLGTPVEVSKSEDGAILTVQDVISNLTYIITYSNNYEYIEFSINEKEEDYYVSSNLIYK